MPRPPGARPVPAAMRGRRPGATARDLFGAPSRSGSPDGDLGGKALHRPLGGVAAIPDAVVEAVGSLLPELEAVGGDPVATPTLRAGDGAVVGKALDHGAHGVLEDVT